MMVVEHIWRKPDSRIRGCVAIELRQLVIRFTYRDPEEQIFGRVWDTVYERVEREWRKAR